ncbi:Hypothetical predicted protein [Paramuricea clavata]|uniref:Uncharacterized protein n=1 Tax=Paramuricea clavata TaxID=317549 RepID=A0A6S7H0F1_PARCT|nr:Hypothetical predicted protein [Paramuricea clavata]
MEGFLLGKLDDWLADQRATNSAKSDVEVKLTKQLFALAKEEEDELGNLLSKSVYWKTLKITAWSLRFLRKSAEDEFKGFSDSSLLAWKFVEHSHKTITVSGLTM